MDTVMPSKLIRLSKSNISVAEKCAVVDVLDSEFLGMGAKVQEFEIKLSEYLGRPSVCVSTGTAALHLALQAIGVGIGDEVLVPSLTYVASFQAISATGAIPVACDVLECSLTISPQDAEAKITSRTKAIMPVHYAGGVGQIDEIYELAKKHQLRVIEDAAHAFGTIKDGRRVGGFGDIVCFSFDGIKNITSGEGGCVTTQDEDVIQKISDSRLLGVENDSQRRYSNQRSWAFDVSSQGWRYHMSDLMAAIGIVQLTRFPSFLVARQSAAKQYGRLLKASSQIRIIENDFNSIVPHIFPIVIFGMNRNTVKEKLLNKGIQTGSHYQPNHMLTKYKNNEGLTLPITEAVHQYILSLPMHADIQELDVTYICKSLLEILDEEDFL